jgi:hypothetical protein
MKTPCPECGTVHEVKTKARNGGKARWKGVSKAERSAILSRAAKARWGNRKSNAQGLATQPAPTTPEKHK